MKTIEHHLRLKSEQHYGKRVPPEDFGVLLLSIPRAVRQAIAMRFAGISKPSGRPTTWLTKAADIRFVDHYGEDDTTLVFEAPILGESAEEIYRQPDLFRPLPLQGDTGFDLLGDVVRDIQARNEESDIFDVSLLKQVSNFKKGINGKFSEADLWGNRIKEKEPVVINQTVIETAEEFKNCTPAPQTVRVMGNLDLIRASTLGFGLILKSGESVRGILQETDPERLHKYWRKDVLVLGHAIFKPNGRLLRIEATTIEDAAEADLFFSVVPHPNKRVFNLKETIRQQQHKKGLAAIIGQWPGDESEEEIEELLREVS